MNVIAALFNPYADAFYVALVEQTLVASPQLAEARMKHLLKHPPFQGLPLVLVAEVGGSPAFYGNPSLVACAQKVRWLTFPWLPEPISIPDQ